MLHFYIALYCNWILINASNSSNSSGALRSWKQEVLWAVNRCEKTTNQYLSSNLWIRLLLEDRPTIVKARLWVIESLAQRIKGQIDPYMVWREIQKTILYISGRNIFGHREWILRRASFTGRSTHSASAFCISWSSEPLGAVLTNNMC